METNLEGWISEEQEKEEVKEEEEECSGPGTERAWDDFGFPVLSYLSETAALVLDSRYAWLLPWRLLVLLLLLLFLLQLLSPRFSRLPHSTRGRTSDLGLLCRGVWAHAQVSVKV